MTDFADAARAPAPSAVLAVARGPTPRKLANLALFGALPVALLVASLRAPGLGWDFRAFYLGAQRYLAGRSPYPGHSLAALADKQGFVYPAPVAAFFVPLALLPYALALGLWLAGSVAALAAGLRVLGVRDWRCLGALFLTHPAQQAVRLGTLMPALMLLLALLWKYRDRVAVAAPLCAVLAVSKLFLFPMIVWLAVTRRTRTALLALAAVAVLCVLGWLPIHFASIASYPSLLHALSSFEQTFSYSLTSLGVALGLSSNAATSVAIAAGIAFLAVAASLGRRSELLAFCLALAASFALSPIVWGHYFVLLAVPLALRRPELSPVWLAAIWIKPDTLQMHAPAVWIGLAVLVMLVQLDLVPLGRLPAARLSLRARQSLGAATVVALLIASSAAGEPGLTRDATLVAARGAGEGGAASVRIDSAAHEVCWRLWTEALPAGDATVTIRAEVGPALRRRTRLEEDGEAGGCARLTRSDEAIAAGLSGRPADYDLVVQPPGLAPISGSFRRT